jgi:CBS-domain-containing membrane protein
VAACLQFYSSFCLIDFGVLMQRSSSMLRAKDIMNREVITVSPETHVTEAAKLLLENHVNGLPVVDEEGALVGIICQSDLVAQQQRLPLPSFFNLLDGLIPIGSPRSFEKEIRKIAAITVSEAMSPRPVAVSPETSLEEIATLMVSKNFHTLPVLENARLVGVVGKEDVLRTLIDQTSS